MKKINSPIPANLGKECLKAANILNFFIDPKVSKYTDKVIPKNILQNCKGIAILTVLKGGFIWSGRAGSGLVIARLHDGRWSAPSAIGTAGIGVGGQIGAQLTDFVMILNTDSAVKAFSHGGNVTLGGNIAVAAGPLGRSAEVSGAILNVAPVFSYSKSKGLFAGVSLEGSVILERKDANEKFYGRRVSARELLSGSVEPPPEASVLYRALELKSSSYTPTGTSLNDSLSQSEPASPYNTPPAPDVGPTSFRNSGYGGNIGRSYLDQSVNSSSQPSPYSAYSGAKSVQDTGGPPVYQSAINTNNSYPTEKQSHQPQQRSAVALFSFDGVAPGDLSFKKGDTINITKSTETQNDWWEGTCNGKSGQFPANYVRVL
ncbi:hypothetical protein BB559_000986 [Furculomyces boomerangus]|uniref:SH3 domain-containing protein n=2 Tax=Harpellales TaxID=61421 RepID=A0A2T9Z3E6_9FUNG|nr:hypothetical protein BB559_004513 [Furculomyces boomerangus]PVU99113.1 hypothetical protein BB559_000986 [Furculomyces boomerangus]PWA02936.1 hypothetical protein BB558_000908 [Smittium angustum]